MADRADREMVKVGNRKYALGSVLGVGGFSEVRRGTDHDTRKRVALKIMYNDPKASPHDLKSQLIQVQKEIKVMKQLNAPNLIRLLGYDLKCVVNGKKAIVMVQQLAPKGELFDYLMYTKKFEQPQAIAIFKQLIAGLKAMHNAGIAHRDLKPENILFDNSYNLKLADFGFSYVFKKGENPETYMRTELGTKGYMAPEILSQRKYTKKADIFASGVILFIVLAGFPPFQNADAKDWWFDKLQKKKYKLFWMAHERTATFSPEAKTLLQDMLAPKEENRLDIAGVEQSAFYNAECLSKQALAQELKDRKSKMDVQKASEAKESLENDPTNRDTLMEILTNDANGNALPKGAPILLKEVLRTPFKDNLSAASNWRDVHQAFSNEMSDQNILDVLKERLQNLDDDNVKEVVKKLLGNVHVSEEKFAELIPELFGETGENDRMASTVLNNLKKSRAGEKIDDYNLVHAFVGLEESATLPEYYPYKSKCYTFQTCVSYGLLGYCLNRFTENRGTMELKPDSSEILLKFGFKKKLLLPEEGPDGIIWREGKMGLKLHILVKLFRDAHFNTNVVTFTNVSKDCMGMNEFTAIIDELRKNRQFFLADFLDAQYQVEDHAELEDMELDDEDVITQDGEIEA